MKPQTMWAVIDENEEIMDWSTNKAYIETCHSRKVIKGLYRIVKVQVSEVSDGK